MKQVSRAIIINGQGKVLLGKRARGTGVGQYALIGGKPHEGETAASAIVREVQEELGVIFSPTFYLERVDAFSDPESPWRVSYFVGPITGDIKLNPSEISEVIFVSEAELEELDIAFDHKERIREFFQTRQKREHM
jgi:mutator protein MutT